VHLVEKIQHAKVDVCTNDAICLEDINKYDKIILSPGPGIPEEAGLLKSLIKEFASTKSILGICLGHQAIGEVFGAKLKNLKTVYHGVSTNIKIHSPTPNLFYGLSEIEKVGRYHSWVIDETTIPESLSVTATDENDYIMAIQHKTFDVQGVQFHPESILTPCGETILKNWLLQ